MSLEARLEQLRYVRHVANKETRMLSSQSYRAVGAELHGLSEEVLPALARRREPADQDKFIGSMELAEKVESFFKGATAPQEVIELHQGEGFKLPISSKIAAIIFTVVMLAAALLDVFLGNGIGALSGVVYAIVLITLVYLVSLKNAWDPVLMGPIIYFVSIAIAGQFNLSTVGSFFMKQTTMLLPTLAFNATWVLGATVIAAALTYLRLNGQKSNEPSQPLYPSEALEEAQK
jgi:hypothetical protein